jgi:hypothetical protein
MRGNDGNEIVREEYKLTRGKGRTECGDEGCTGVPVKTTFRVWCLYSTGQRDKKETKEQKKKTGRYGNEKEKDEDNLTRGGGGVRRGGVYRCVAAESPGLLRPVRGGYKGRRRAVRRTSRGREDV